MTAPEAPAPARGIPPAEVEVDAALVRDLLRSQHPDLAGQPIRLVATGWDNYTFRLGDSLAVRLPRISDAAALVLKEQHWLPLIAPGLLVPVPVPVRIGRPDTGFPWPWSVVPWIAGRSAEHAPLAPDQAGCFGRFLAGLHRPATPGAPRNDYRGIPLAQVEGVEERIERLAPALAEAGVDGRRLGELWRTALTVPRDVPETLIHGDLHPKNLVVDSGRLTAVLDWGDMTVGDPATDLAATWMLFPLAAHPDVWREYGGVTAATTARAVGWAVCFGTNLLDVGLAGDPPFAAIGRLTLRRLAGQPPEAS